MNLVTEWVMQIIVFILLGTIVELLLPNNSMKKYVNIVVGLLLLLILTKPILYLFSVDVTYQLDQIERAIFDNKQYAETENLVEKQKKDIQAEQDAYIWNEVKLQLMKEVNPILIEEYSVQIIDVAFSFNEPIVDNYDSLEEVFVTLTENPDEAEKEESLVQPIVIEAKQQDDRPEKARSQRDKKIINTLKEVWGLDKTNIQIVWEGGTS
ncbi:stage III sporulation protein AF [Pseudogracilibacillus sp. SE30717A]|uniref:stage III sporulation protein AF n=1 Tax=Pseudogracilibacillus sp. SE30717A TaxID=3098293 RepID=UPI00300E33ED